MEISCSLYPLPISWWRCNIIRSNHLTMERAVKKALAVLSSCTCSIEVDEVEALKVGGNVGDVPERAAAVQFFLSEVGFPQSADVVDLTLPMTSAREMERNLRTAGA